MKKSERIYPYLLPSAFTAGNVLCGFLSIYSNFNKNFVMAGWYIMVAMIFDILDGRVARMSKGTSNFGAEFDSLADLVSFGMAPSLLVYFTLLYSSKVHLLGLFVSFFYLLCGAIRLARFNISPTSDHFSGMPIPGGAALMATIVLLNSKLPGSPFTRDIYFLLLFITLIGVMMVSNVPYPSLKKNKKNKKGLNRIIGIVFVSTVLIGIFVIPEESIFLMAISYAISGPIYSFYQFFENSGKSDRDKVTQF